MLTRIAAVMLLTCIAAFTPATATDRQPGLIVKLYDIGHGMHQIPELAPSQLPNVLKIIPTLELRSDRGDFKPFEGNFYTEVAGYLEIAQPGTYTFRLISDDGSTLWIDDRLVINHDGLHGAVPKDGDIDLTAGQHNLRVAHFESGGDEHLELQWRQPDAPDAKFELIPAAALTHAADVSREISPGTKRIIPPLRRGLPGDGTPVAGMHPGFTVETVPLSVAKAALGTSEADEEAEYETPTETWTWLPDPPHEKLVCLLHKSDVQTYIDGHATQATGYLAPRGQLMGGDDANGTLHRVFIDVTDRGFNAVVFRLASGLGNHARFSQGGGDKAIYCFAEPFWREDVKPISEVQRLTRTGQMAFEMLLVRAMKDGLEIEFTKPLDARCGWEPESYYVEQWPFFVEDTAARRHEGVAPGVTIDPEMHSPRRDGVRYPVKSASVSPDHRRVFLETRDLKESHVVYIRLLPPCYSEDGERPWSTEAWYTLNVIPQDRYGKVLPPPEPEPQNFLTDEEKAAGWKLLFDGKTTAGWRGYRKDYMPDGWVAQDDCLVRVGPGGDICTVDEFDNFELKLEWRICAAGNSGIFFRVSEKYDWPFFTGPEMQVLDNAEHADGRNPKTSAGSNYGLHAPLRDVTVPVGFFNQVRIVANGPHIEYWLNGVKIIEYELWADEWKEMVAGSKFKAWPNYGLTKKGHFVLQDHGDRVWYRNIKIRTLNAE